MKDMDKIFRSKLYNHESALPDDLWNRIETGMEKKKRKGFIWFLFSGISLLGILSATAYFGGYMDSNMNPITTENVPSTEIVVQNMANDPEEINEVVLVNNEEVENSLEIIPAKKIAAKSTPDNYDAKQASPPVHPESEEKLLSVLEVEQIVLPITNEDNSQIDIPQISVIYPFLLTNETRDFKDPVGCPTFSRRNNVNLFIEAYYQPLFAYSLISSNSPEVGDAYVNLRKDSESSLYSWSAGFNVGWISDYNIGVKAGAEYEVINERFTYEDPEAIRNQTVITIDTIFNGDGTFNISSDTTIVQVSGDEIQNIHNYHKTISIPIHLLYQINFEKLAIELSGGPIFNINYKNRGKIVDPSNQDQWFTNGESGSYNVYKDRLNVGFSLSVSAMYSINEHIQLFARPTFKYTPGTMSVSTSPFNQTYMNTGLSLGARYYFSGNPNY